MSATSISRRRIASVAAAVALLLAVGWLVSGLARRWSATPASTQAGTKPIESDARLAARGSDAKQRAPAADAVPPAESQPGEGPAPAAEGEGAVDGDASESNYDAAALAWANVDMEQVRKAMPDNLYFKMSAPTKDEAVLQQREEERERWNVEYGKVLSGTGTEEEVRAYYDLRARLATDYVEFATHLLDHYGDDLPDRDVAMLKLARQLNLARLEEIPRKVEEALERKRMQDEARAAWLADQRAFEGGGGDEDESD